VPSSINDYSPLLLYFLPAMNFSSSILTKLCINVNDFNDVCALLDGRLKQLTTLIVQVGIITDLILTSPNRVSLCSEGVGKEKKIYDEIPRHYSVL